MPISSLRILCLVTVLFCDVQWSLGRGIPRRSFLSRRAIDGSRGRKYFDPDQEGAFDSYGSAGGQYDQYDHMTDLSDIRKNVPGEPGVDYPAYTILPQTGFTCEGRSRGYYADEAAGCQVFHVCHDVLVSSFLCPIGSTFSQKLLTCDWWTKVDCASTNRYLAVNRNNYQIDDDEMIRNAYVMISLQSAVDVTKDGLVDPDSGARIIDYSALADRTMGYMSGFRRITDYPSVDTTGNDLPNGFEDYSQQNYQQIVYDRYQQKTAKASPVYQSKYHLEDKGRSPYHAAPIIRHGYQDRSGDSEYHDDYRSPDGFTNQLQTSYAPTVPTVTTTTRRFYSPTVPTTYRPSTLAYSKLDLLVDSSDHLYAHSKSLVTPPTIARQNDDSKDIESGGSETRHDDSSKSENASPLKTDGDDRKDEDVRFKDDEVSLGLEEKSEASFKINVTDAIDEDEVFRQQNDRPVIKYDSEGSVEDIETKDSIGIARALNNLSGRDIVQNQDPVDQASKNENEPRGLATPTPRTDLPEFYSETDVANSTQILKKSDDFVAIDETGNDRITMDHEDIANSTTRSVEESTYTETFDDETTQLPMNKNRQQSDEDSVRISISSVTANPVINTTERSIDKVDESTNGSSSDDNRTVDQNSSSSKSISSFNDRSTIEFDFKISQPVQFLEPPPIRFLINVPEETRFTTIGEGSVWSPGISTTEISGFSSTFPENSRDKSPVYNENIDGQSLIDYADDLKDHPVHRVISGISTPIPWLLSTWHDRTIVDVPLTDIVPPIVDYNDGFGDFLPPHRDENEHSRAAEFDRAERVKSQRTQDSSTTPKDNSETEILNQYKDFQFTIRDAINSRVEPKVNSKLPCHSVVSDKQATLCETSPAAPEIAVSTPSTQGRTIPFDIKTTTMIPEQLVSLGDTRSFEKSVTILPKESSIPTTQSLITVNIDTERSTLKTVTPRYESQAKEEKPEERTEKMDLTTASSILPSTRPGSLKQIAETIDRHNSPYQVSLTVKKNEDLETITDDFISRLIAQHQQPALDSKDQLDDFEIIKSVEPEDEIVLHTPRFSDTSHTPSNKANNSVFNVASDTIEEPRELNSNVSMLNLLHLMAELLKLDRLPRPFSAKELHNIQLETSLDLDESSSVTENPTLDRSQTRTPFRDTNSKSLVFDTLKIPVNNSASKVLDLNQNKASFVTTNPLMDHSQVKMSFENANFKVSTFNPLRTPINIVTPKTLLNVDQNKPSLITTSSLLDRSQTRAPYRNSRVPFFDISRRPSSVTSKSFPDIPSRANSDHSIKSKTSQLKTENITTRPLQKHEILEQLSENFGQPLYRGNPNHRSRIFDLPQVQRSLDFETGLPIEESKHVIDEAAEEDSISSTVEITTTTQETITMTNSEKTIVETEFVPSIGFSFDTDEDREEYVEAILGGLINDHDRDRDKNESGNTQLTDGNVPRNETLNLKQQNLKDV